MAEREYRRLTWWWRKRAIKGINLSRNSLWLGRDHLLCIERNLYAETYKRFYFRDIQAITTRRTSRRMVVSLVLAGLAALSIVVGLLIGETAAYITFGLIALLGCVIPLWINLLLGPTCTCQLRTAVQIEDLPISRLRKARKVRDRIRPMIAEAQGQMTPDEVHAQMQMIGNSPPAGISPPGADGRYVIDDVNLPPRIL